MKRTFLGFIALAVALMAGPAFAALPAPANFTAAWDTDVLECDWDDVTGATKYSVDITATATYDTGEDDPDTGEDILAEVEVEASFGTSDRTDGDPIGQSDLDIPEADIVDLLAALDAELVLLGVDAISVDLEAKVKALNPGKGKGRQNNPFSSSVSVPLP